MATSKRKSSVSPLKDTEVAARRLRAALDDLSRQGHPASLEQGLDKIAEELEVPREALALLSQDAGRHARVRREDLGRELRDRAENASCTFSYKPPSIHFGCVTFHEDPKDPDAWLMSVLGADPIRRLLGHDADRMASEAEEVIASVESALSRIDAFLRDAASAYEMLKGSIGTSDGVSPNLLLFLAARGKGLKRELVSGDTPSSAGLSRAQGGFLLRKAQQLGAESGIRVRLRPATQHVTADPWRFVPVPEEATPRSHVAQMPVGRVFIEKKEDPA